MCICANMIFFSFQEIFHDIFIRVFLFLVVIPVLWSCSVIYYKVGKWYERHAHEGLFPVEGDGRSRRRFKRVFSTARNMVMVILFCWTPALALILLSTLMIWTNVEQRSLFWLYVIQAATLSLQGFLNSMVYAWRRPNFTEAVLGENTPLIAHDRLAFFDESLKSSFWALTVNALRDIVMLWHNIQYWGRLTACLHTSWLHDSLDWNTKHSHLWTEDEKDEGNTKTI